MEPKSSGGSAVIVLVTVIIVIIIAAAYYFGWVRRANQDAAVDQNKPGINIQLGGESKAPAQSPSTY